MNDSKVDLSEYFFFFYPIRNIGGGLKVKSGWKDKSSVT